MNVKNRVTSKTVEVCDRKFEIKKMAALTGSFVAMQVLTKALPMGLAMQVGISLPGGTQAMSKNEFIELQKDVLSCVYEILPAGKTRIFDDAGNFAVMDIEDNAPLIVRLTIESLQFNFKDFFDASLWVGLLPPEISLMLSKLLTSMNTFTPQSSEGTGDNTKPGMEPTT